jgi:NADH-quinone oxidoreductase subunit M
MPDLSAREWLCFLPLMALTLWLGIYPKPFLDALHVSVQHLITQAR